MGKCGMTNEECRSPNARLTGPRLCFIQSFLGVAPMALGCDKSGLQFLIFHGALLSGLERLICKDAGNAGHALGQRREHFTSKGN